MSANLKDSNYYDVLEVPPNATQREIQEAFKRAKATYANDNPALYSMFTREEAKELLRLIEEAYAVLGDQRAREAYDQHLHGAPMPSNVLSRMEDSPNPQFVVPAAEAVHYSATDEAQWKTHPAAFTEEGAGQVKVKVKTAPATGMGQTKYGTYEIDPKFEDEIRHRTDFDGAFLQKIRLYKKLTLDNVSTDTRVSRTYLTAIENMDVPHLPAPVFVRGFISHLARALGLNEKRVIDSYMKFLKDKIGNEE